MVLEEYDVLINGRAPNFMGLAGAYSLMFLQNSAHENGQAWIGRCVYGDKQ